MSWQEIKDIIPREKKDLTKENVWEFVYNFKWKFGIGEHVLQYYRKNGHGHRLKEKLRIESIEERVDGVFISFFDKGHLSRAVYLEYKDNPKYVWLQTGLYVSNPEKGDEWAFILAQ